MKWTAVLLWGVVSGVAGLGLYAFFNAIAFLWYATGPLLHADLRKDYFLMTGLWFAGFLMCGVSVVWLLNRRRDSMNRLLTDEEETQ